MVGLGSSSSEHRYPTLFAVGGAEGRISTVGTR